MNVRAALGSDVGRKGRRRNGVSRAVGTWGQQCALRARIISLALPGHLHNRATTNIPRAFSSWVQPRIRSCTSSGATSVRCHASVQTGFAGPRVGAEVFLEDFLVALESLLRKTRAKKGIVRWETHRKRKRDKTREREREEGKKEVGDGGRSGRRSRGERYRQSGAAGLGTHLLGARGGSGRPSRHVNFPLLSTSLSTLYSRSLALSRQTRSSTVSRTASQFGSLDTSA